MRLSREAILIAVAAEQILTRDGGVDIDPRRSRFLRYKQRHLPEPKVNLNGGPFSGWLLHEVPDWYFMEHIYRRLEQFNVFGRWRAEWEFKQRKMEKQDPLVEKFYGKMRFER